MSVITVATLSQRTNLDPPLAKHVLRQASNQIDVLGQASQFETDSLREVVAYTHFEVQKLGDVSLHRISQQNDDGCGPGLGRPFQTA